MPNRFQLNVQAGIQTEIAIVSFEKNVSGDQTGTGYDARPFAVQSDADGWTQYVMPAAMGDIKALILYNPSTNANNVRVALTAAATYVTNEIPPGEWCRLVKPTPSAIYLSHRGGTGTTQEVEPFGFET